jgi:hypothetical protein
MAVATSLTSPMMPPMVLMASIHQNSRLSPLPH